MQLKFGLSRAVPPDVTCAWGARMIEPADIVPDRVDWQGAEQDCEVLSAWLTAPDGPLDKARAYLRDPHSGFLPQSDAVTTVYSDRYGTIVASTNRSFGYVYAAAWLFPAVTS